MSSEDKDNLNNSTYSSTLNLVIPLKFVNSAEVSNIESERSDKFVSQIKKFEPKKSYEKNLKTNNQTMKIIK